MSLWSRIISYLPPYYRQSKRRTIKYAFPAVALVGLLLGAAVISSDSVSSIRMEISDTSVRAGQAVTLAVYVNAHTPVNAVDIEIEVPEEYLRLTGIDTGESVITLWTEEPYFENGVVYFRGGTFRKGFVGEHQIATISAVTKASGLVDIAVENVQLLAGDGSGTFVDVDSDEQAVSLYISQEDGTLTTASRGIEGTITVAIVTDIDGDGKVTLQDVSRFMGAWSSNSIVYDFNGDRKMTFVDFGIILADSFLR